MSTNADRLYELLPVVHRIRDTERGYPLRALLRVIGEQVNVIEDDIARLYDNWFIETCDEWVVPYIADLIGYHPVTDAGNPGSVDTAEGRNRNKILISRKDVAATLGFRKRKGTLALLESLANGVAGWPACPVESYAMLGWTQHVNHLRMGRGKTVSLRDGADLDRINSPFETLAHTADVRRIASRHSPGHHNLSSVGLFVWRLNSYSVTHAPAHSEKEYPNQYPNRFTFSALGNDVQLYTKPEPEAEPTSIADEINLPTAIRRRGLEERFSIRPLKTNASTLYYGEGKSVAIYAPGWLPEPADQAASSPQPQSQPQPQSPSLALVPAASIVPADLSDWQYRVERDHVALDPVLGRIMFPDDQLPEQGVWVSYHYGFSADIGGGEYKRDLSEPRSSKLYRVSQDNPAPGTFNTINAALAQWRNDQQAPGSEPADGEEKDKWRAEKEKLRAAVIEIQDSGVYNEALAIVLGGGESLQIRAANRTRPIIWLPDSNNDSYDAGAAANAFTITGKKASRFKLDGLIVAGQGLRINGPQGVDDSQRLAEDDPCDVTIRHSTLVPGWTLASDAGPGGAGRPSLELVNTSARLVIESCIIGTIHVRANEVQTDPVEISVSDSIVDATVVDRTAIGAANSKSAFAHLSIVRSTVIGQVNAHAILSAENVIFMGSVGVARRQLGCMRFCYVSPGSRTPQRYRCQPDLVIAELGGAPDGNAIARESQRVRPRFNSLRYGEPEYCRVTDDCPEEITRGADDESEMGVFHDLFNPQRLANLRARLAEYTPAGMEAGVLFEN